MKIAPVMRAFDSIPDKAECKIVHTGQHYDAGMSQTFFDELGIPAPAYNLGVGSGSHAVQTANIMIKFEEVCLKEKPDWVLVVGDVNSTAACGLVAKKLCIGLAHIEAGLRSGDRTMPEEINRMVTDSISDLLFVTEKQGLANLKREGHSDKEIHFVGHVMIDNLYHQIKQLDATRATAGNTIRKNLGNRKFAAMTLHRPGNVDNKETLNILLSTINECSSDMPVLFPCHPRTRKKIEEFGLGHHVTILPSLANSDTAKVLSTTSGIILTDPLGYMDFLTVWKDATVIVTDSGGLQEETTALKIPCITVRENTERPITADVGSNVIAGRDPEKIRVLFAQAITGQWKKSDVPELWDGKTSERIVRILAALAGLFS
jgi:UDP-N-acetylglucosamine 2-epimerase (non-hydrolysing)